MNVPLDGAVEEVDDITVNRARPSVQRYTEQPGSRVQRGESTGSYLEPVQTPATAAQQQTPTTPPQQQSYEGLQRGSGSSRPYTSLGQNDSDEANDVSDDEQRYTDNPTLLAKRCDSYLVPVSSHESTNT